MSTVRSMDYRIREEQERQLKLKYEQERLAMLSMKVQQEASRLYNQGKTIAIQKNRLADQGQILAATDERLQVMEHDLNQCHQQLRLNQQALQKQLDTLHELQSDANLQSELLTASMSKARNALVDSAKLSDSLLNHSAFLTDAALQSRYSQVNQEQLENQIKQIERELDFVSQEAALSPAAMVTLSAMRQNGYQLRQVISKEGLISYFEEVESGRQIAVKLNHPSRSGENEKNWELLTETFNMAGEQCLDEISDFETAVEEQGSVDLIRGKINIYPKDNRGRSKESVFRPPKPITQKSLKKSRPIKRVKET